MSVRRHLSRYIFAGLTLGLLALASLGVWQVIAGQDEPRLQSLSDEEREALEDEADERARQAVRDFIDSGADLCSVSLVDHTGDFALPYSDVPQLANHADVIVVGRPTANVLEYPEQHTLAGRVITTLQIDEVVKGSTSQPTLTADLANRVMKSGSRLVRFAGAELDSCVMQSLLVFLRDNGGDEYSIVSYQGWASVEAGNLQAAEFSGIFDGYSNAQNLLDDVRQTVQRQAEDGLPNGLLLCRDTWQQISVCPGDRVNLFQALAFDTATEAFVVTTDPGPSPLALGRVDLPPGSAQLDAILEALDVDVTMEALGPEPDDLHSISFRTETLDSVGRGLKLKYSPGQQIVHVSPNGGQFGAPPAFQQAMEPFLAPSD